MIQANTQAAIAGNEDSMTLWSAYRIANRRRCGVHVTMTPECAGLGNGRTELSLHVAAHLVNGWVAVQQGLTSDWVMVAPDRARTIEVTRDI